MSDPVYGEPMRDAGSYDVAVVGGGPAGSAAALALLQVRPDLRVLLVEASEFERWRIGETLAPGGRQLLEGLGCWPRVRAAGVIECYGTRAVWGDATPHDNEFVFSARGNGWHLDRAAFDAALVACAHDAGARVWRGARFVQSARAGDGAHEGWRLTIVHDGVRRTVEASVVIDATGRNASFATRQGADRVVDDRLAGVAMAFTAAKETHAVGGVRDVADDVRDVADGVRHLGGDVCDVEAGVVDTTTLVEAQEDGWWYSAAIPGGRVIAAWMSDADLIRRDGLKQPERWLERLRASRETRARLGGCAPRWPVGIWSARSQRLAQVCGDRWLAVGDAASAFDPLSSAGVLKALYTGKIGAFAVLDLLRGDPSGFARYRAHVEREYERYLATRRWFYTQEQRWPQAEFWKRRHAPAEGYLKCG